MRKPVPPPITEWEILAIYVDVHCFYHCGFYHIFTVFSLGIVIVLRFWTIPRFTADIVSFSYSCSCDITWE